MTDTSRLVYYSRNRLPGSAMDAGVIEAILETSRINNSRVGVTGALMFNSGCFAQVLEGPREAVEATFERIQQDERHGDASLLAFDRIAQRAFGHWSMGFVGLAGAGAHSFAGVAAETGFDLPAMTGDHVLDLMRCLAEEQHAQVG